MLRAPTARLLDEADEPAVARLLAGDPVAACVLAGRVESAGTAPASLGAPLWGIGGARVLDAVCLAGANLIPFAAPGAERAAARDTAPISALKTTAPFSIQASDWPARTRSATRAR